MSKRLYPDGVLPGKTDIVLLKYRAMVSGIIRK